MISFLRANLSIKALIKSAELVNEGHAYPSITTLFT